MTPAVREPAVAGRFYPGDSRALGKSIEQYLAPAAEAPVTARMVMAPHAGYVYSGAIAGATYARIAAPAVAIVICPNHTGLGVRRSLWPDGEWHLPGFSLSVDRALAAALREQTTLGDDRMAHLREHAIEVQLPFLHALQQDLRIVPVCLANLDFAECSQIGKGIAAAVAQVERERGESVLLVASSDMSHYISADEARFFDMHAIERVLALDPEGLYEVVNREDISMCGYIPTTVGLVAARALGATQAELVRYGNSGDVSGDFEQVVGYAGIVVR